MIPIFQFPNGVQVPMLGIGLDQVRDLELAYQSLLHAFSVGYRSVDTASSYANEEAVGRAVRDCGLRREELYITTKLTAAD
ncbi:MAG: aldo/keto reductase, partial [Oscillospiraceae bacterium]